MKFKSIKDAQKYFVGFRKTQAELIAADFKFEKVQYFAKILGNPQNKLKVIHVAGTSGKGSTCTALSYILGSLGKKVGLSVSPHILDLRERTQINNSLISERKFLDYLKDFVPFIEIMERSEFGRPTYFEIMIMFAYVIFQKENVEYAVMETGLGGRLDATNVATSQDKIAVITQIGLDHTEILGKTLSKISFEKAAIIHEGNLTITCNQRPAVLSVIEDQVEKCHGSLCIVKKNAHFGKMHTVSGKIIFDFKYKNTELKNLESSLNGMYQVENISLALAVACELSERDSFSFDENAVRASLKKIYNPGRFDELTVNGKKLIIDGAHNPQKMAAFIKSLKSKYPDVTFDFLLSFKRGKNIRAMLKYIAPYARSITATEFVLSEHVEILSAVSPDEIRDTVKNNYKHIPVKVIPNVSEAVHSLLQKKNGRVVATGSLYLASEIYKALQ